MRWVLDSAVTTAPTAADDANAPSRLVSQRSARVALAARDFPSGPHSGSEESGRGAGGSRGDKPDSTIDARPAGPSRPRDISVQTELMERNGAAVMTTARAHDRDDHRETSRRRQCDNTATRYAHRQHRCDGRRRRGQQHIGRAPAPGTARKPATEAKPLAITLSVSPAIRFPYTRCATIAAKIATKPASAVTAAVLLKSRIVFLARTFRTSASPPMQVMLLAAAAPISWLACRVQGGAIAFTVADTASATSSWRGAGSGIAGWLSSRIAPSRIPLLRKSRRRRQGGPARQGELVMLNHQSPNLPSPWPSKMSTISGIRLATGNPAGRTRSTTAVPAFTDTRRSPGSDADNIADKRDPFGFGS